VFYCCVMKLCERKREINERKIVKDRTKQKGKKVKFYPNLKAQHFRVIGKNLEG
jgi:hypothetical protein